MSTLTELAAELKAARQNVMTARAEHQAILARRTALNRDLQQCFEDEQTKLAEIEALKVTRDDVMQQISARAP